MAEARGVNTPSGVTKRVIHASASVHGRDKKQLHRLASRCAQQLLALRRGLIASVQRGLLGGRCSVLVGVLISTRL